MDFATFLAPLSSDAPSGEAVREDPRFDEIVSLIEPASRAQRLASGGDRVDWHEVFDRAATLAHDGRDLRLLVVLVRATFNLEGLSGLAPGFGLLTGTLDGFWNDLHPRLRARDDPREAAIGRISALKQLENDDNGLLGDLKLNVVLAPRGLGPVTGLDLAGAAISEFEALNEVPSGLGQKEKARIASSHEELVKRVTAATRALATETPKQAAGIAAALAAALEALQALSVKLSEKVGTKNGASIGFPELEQLLTRMRTTITRAEEAVADTRKTEAAPETAPMVGASAAPGAAAPPAAAQGGIHSRTEVEHCLDQIIEFYERTEPSSPIPHLARRMRRMVPMDFLELMAEIAPSGMKEFRSVAGVGDEKAKSEK